MNYGDLLYLAHENKCSVSNKEVRCYKTKFAPPQKLNKSKVSSDNIKKFLARKEEEEKQKLQEAQRKKHELLALRSQDKKAQKRVQVMLKRTKSANKSVMEDAIDNVNTADTLNGPAQCDEDDYGYVSQEASSFYNKLMNKYENMPAEPSIFSKSKREVKDLAAAKDRVKMALQKEAEEAELPHRKKRKSKYDTATDSIIDSDSGNDSLEEQNMKKLKETSNDGHEKDRKKNPAQEQSDNKPKNKKCPTGPPPLDFNELLKLAKEKQHEPIMIDTNAKSKEPPRLMTSKEKAEYIKEEERKRNRFRRERVASVLTQSPDNKVSSKEEPLKSLAPKQLLQKIPKLTDGASSKEIKEKVCDSPPKPDKQILTSKKTSIGNKSSLHSVSERLKKTSDVWSKPCNLGKKDDSVIEKISSNPYNKSILTENSAKTVSPSPKFKKKLSEEYVPKPKFSQVNKELSDIDREIELLRKKKMLLALKAQQQKAPVPTYVPTAIKSQSKVGSEMVRTKNTKLLKKKPVMKKRCINSDSEYDSELDDFIDDGPEDGEDYSKVISEIFGYDKSRYRDLNEDDDDECMESNFAQQMKEEYVSTKIGILEDLEDIRKEQEEKKRLKERKKMKMKASRS